MELLLRPCPSTRSVLHPLPLVHFSLEKEWFGGGGENLTTNGFDRASIAPPPPPHPLEKDKIQFRVLNVLVMLCTLTFFNLFKQKFRSVVPFYLLTINDH